MDNGFEDFRFSVEIFDAADELLSEGDDLMAEKIVKKCYELWKKLLEMCGEDVRREAFTVFSGWIREGALHER